MPSPLLSRLAERPLLCDGAMGTLLYARGVALDACFDVLNLNEAKLVQSEAEFTRQETLLRQNVTAQNTYDLLRQTSGLEVHDQGQGPGFASDASLRGFSSDHSTDLALWIAP